jgi:hypothetical protein
MKITKTHTTNTLEMDLAFFRCGIRIPQHDGRQASVDYVRLYPAHAKLPEINDIINDASLLIGWPFDIQPGPGDIQTLHCDNGIFNAGCPSIETGPRCARSAGEWRCTYDQTFCSSLRFK